VASSEYHRKQAEILAGLALTEPDQAKAAQLSLLALQHRDLVDKLETSQTLPPPSSGDDHRDCAWPGKTGGQRTTFDTDR
jgi:hypothetical protein